MKNKIILSSIGFLVFAFILNIYIHYGRLLRFPERKCAQYRPLHLDLTFGRRKECLQSMNKGQSELNLDTVEEMNFRGYNATTYTILSADGYYSSIYRISGCKNSHPKPGKRAILIYHGFPTSAKSWIIQPGSRNLVFTMVDAGYEVWLPNGRGTTPSRNHTHLDPDSLEYWNFGIKELSTQDFPLIVMLMLKETGTDKVYYICYSMSCWIYLAGLIDVPDLNDKFKAGIILAPGGFYGSAYNPIMLFFRGILGTPLEQVAVRLLGGKLDMSYLVAIFNNICSWSFMRCGICDSFVFLLFGADPEQLDYSNFQNIMAKVFDAGPLQAGFHAVQCDVACAFQRYNYGPTRNLLEYGSSEPPIYNTSGIRVPAYIFYGESDSFVTPLGAAKARDVIPPKFMKGFYQVEWPKFNHIDFLIAKDADVLLYNKVLDIINKLEE